MFLYFDQAIVVLQVRCCLGLLDRFWDVPDNFGEIVPQDDPFVVFIAAKHS